MRIGRRSFVGALAEARATPRPTLRGIARDLSAMVFITLAIGGLAATLAYFAAGRVRLGRLAGESVGWPRAAAVVTDTRVVWSSAPRSGRAYWPTVRYRYAVAGRQRWGDQVSFRATYTRAEAEAAVARHPIGSSAEVSYRPSDPGTSVLEAGDRAGDGAPVLLVVAALAATGLALFCLVITVLVSKPRPR